MKLGKFSRQIGLLLILIFLLYSGRVYASDDLDLKNYLKWSKTEFKTRASSVTSFARLIENEKEILFLGCYKKGRIEMFQKLEAKEGFRLVKSIRLDLDDIRDIKAFRSGVDQYTIVVASELSNKIQVLEYVESTGQWTKPESFRISGPTSLNIVDLNNDGYLDILVGSTGSGSFWLSNDKNVRFQKKLIGSAFLGIEQIRLIDYNEDGFTDFIGASESRKSLILALNDGKGKFTPKDIVTGITGVLDFLIADVDIDCDLDIVVASHNSKGLLLLKNDHGEFTEKKLGDIKNPTSIQTLDLMGDGNLSLVVSSFDETYLTLLYNKKGDFKQAKLEVDAREITKLEVKQESKGHYKLLTSSFSSGKFAEIELNVMRY